MAFLSNPSTKSKALYKKSMTEPYHFVSQYEAYNDHQLNQLHTFWTWNDAKSKGDGSDISPDPYVLELST